MSGKCNFCVLLASLFLLVSCLHSRTTSQVFAVKAGIKVNYGNAAAKINGNLTENIYYDGILYRRTKDEKYYDNPLIGRESITKNETKRLSAGDEYRFSVLPTEVVTIHIVSLDGNDVEIISYDHGNEKTYTIKGTDKMGVLIAFQNR